MQKNLRQFIRYWLPLIVWLIIISTASTDMMSAEHTSRFIGPLLRWLSLDLSAAGLAQVQLFVRKAAHVTEYAILAALLVRAFLHGAGKMKLRHALPSWLFCIAAAALDEFHQSFVASRTGSPIDVMIDATGALVGLWIYGLLLRRSAGRTRTE